MGAGVRDGSGLGEGLGKGVGEGVGDSLGVRLGELTELVFCCKAFSICNFFFSSSSFFLNSSSSFLALSIASCFFLASSSEGETEGLGVGWLDLKDSGIDRLTGDGVGVGAKPSSAGDALGWASLEALAVGRGVVETLLLSTPEVLMICSCAWAKPWSYLVIELERSAINWAF